MSRERPAEDGAIRVNDDRSIIEPVIAADDGVGGGWGGARSACEAVGQEKDSGLKGLVPAVSA